MLKHKYWIALQQSKGLGIVSLTEIYEKLSALSLSISDIFDLSEEELKEEFDFKKSIVEGILSAQQSIKDIESDYMDIVDAGIKPILFFEKNYPSSLKEKLKSNMPPILYAYGNSELLNSTSCALLGDQQVSPKGEMICLASVKELAKHDITITSGMAKGIGTIAHRAAMDNNGNTISIIPCGILRFKMSKILEEVFNEKNFLIVSPFYPTKELSEFNAHIRNRLICALSKTVYIIEASKDSGIIEAAKSANKVNTPLYTTEYGQYPENALGNKELLTTYKAQPVRGKMVGNSLLPNIDQLISDCKFK